MIGAALAAAAIAGDPRDDGATLAAVPLEALAASGGPAALLPGADARTLTPAPEPPHQEAVAADACGACA